MERDPNKRLGYRPGGGGFEDLKAHPWFTGIDWNALYNKEVVPPFEPDVSECEQPDVELNKPVETGKFRCHSRTGGATAGGKPIESAQTERRTGRGAHEPRDAYDGGAVRPD